MTIQELSLKLHDRKLHPEILSIELESNSIEEDYLVISFMNPTLQDLVDFGMLLTLNGFQTSRHLNVKGSCITYVVFKNND